MRAESAFAAILVAGALHALAAEPAGLPSTPPAAADLELRDQHGEAGRLADFRGEPVVAFVVTARRLRNTRAWEEALRERHDDLRTVRIADLPADSPASYEDVAAKLRKRVPDEVPVWIDLDRVWARELALDTGRPNVLVFDRGGVPIAHVRGLVDAALLETISAALSDLESGG